MPGVVVTALSLTFDNLPTLAEHPRGVQDQQGAGHAGVVVLEYVADASGVRHGLLAATAKVEGLGVE